MVDILNPTTYARITNTLQTSIPDLPNILTQLSTATNQSADDILRKIINALINQLNMVCTIPTTNYASTANKIRLLHGEIDFVKQLYRQNCSGMQTSVGDLNTKLTDCNKQLETLQNDLNASNIENKHLNEDLYNVTLTCNSSLQRVLDARTAEQESLNRIIAERDKATQDLNALLQLKEQTDINDTVTRQEQNDRLNEYLEKIKQLNEESTKNLDHIKSLQMDIYNLKQTIDSLTENNTQLTLQNEKLSNQTTPNTQYMISDESVNNLKTLLRIISPKSDATDIQIMMIQLTDYLNATKGIEIALTKVQNEKRDIETTNKLLQEQLSDQQGKIQQLQKKYTDDINLRNKALDAEQSRIAEIEQRTDQYVAEVDNIKMQNEQLKSSNQQLIKSNDQLLAVINNTQNDTKSLQQAYSRNQLLENRYKELNEMLQALAQNINDNTLDQPSKQLILFIMSLLMNDNANIPVNINDITTAAGLANIKLQSTYDASQLNYLESSTTTATTTTDTLPFSSEQNLDNQNVSYEQLSIGQLSSSSSNTLDGIPKTPGKTLLMSEIQPSWSDTETNQEMPPKLSISINTDKLSLANILKLAPNNNYNNNNINAGDLMDSSCVMSYDKSTSSTSTSQLQLDLPSNQQSGTPTPETTPLPLEILEIEITETTSLPPKTTPLQPEITETTSLPPETTPLEQQSTILTQQLPPLTPIQPQSQSTTSIQSQSQSTIPTQQVPQQLSSISTQQLPPLAPLSQKQPSQEQLTIKSLINRQSSSSSSSASSKSSPPSLSKLSSSSSKITKPTNKSSSSSSKITKPTNKSSSSSSSKITKPTNKSSSSLSSIGKPTYKPSSLTKKPAIDQTTKRLTNKSTNQTSIAKQTLTTSPSATIGRPVSRPGSTISRQGSNVSSQSPAVSRQGSNVSRSESTISRQGSNVSSQSTAVSRSESTVSSQSPAVSRSESTVSSQSPAVSRSESTVSSQQSTLKRRKLSSTASNAPRKISILENLLLSSSRTSSNTSPTTNAPDDVAIQQRVKILDDELSDLDKQIHDFEQNYRSYVIYFNGRSENNTISDDERSRLNNYTQYFEALAINRSSGLEYRSALLAGNVTYARTLKQIPELQRLPSNTFTSTETLNIAAMRSENRPDSFISLNIDDTRARNTIENNTTEPMISEELSSDNEEVNDAKMDVEQSVNTPNDDSMDVDNA